MSRTGWVKSEKVAEDDVIAECGNGRVRLEIACRSAGCRLKVPEGQEASNTKLIQSRKFEGRRRRKMPGRCKKFEKHRSMSNAEGDRGDEAGWDTGHFRPQFLTVAQKHCIENIFKREGVMGQEINR
jgi:hypothetical protein